MHQVSRNNSENLSYKTQLLCSTINSYQSHTYQSPKPQFDTTKLRKIHLPFQDLPPIPFDLLYNLEGGDGEN